MAHIDAGKTTTSERILYHTGLTHKIGEVPRRCRYHGLDGTGAGTWYHYYVCCNHTHWNWHDNNYKINLIDTGDTLTLLQR